MGDVFRGYAEYGDYQIYDRRQKQTRAHKSTDIAVVSDESVDKLPEGVDQKKSRPDETEFSGSQNIPVNQRLLHHTEAHAAHIVEAVTGRNSNKCASAHFPVSLLNFLFRHLKGRRTAYSEKFVYAHLSLFVSIIYSSFSSILTY